jgi:hypothetical protein
VSLLLPPGEKVVSVELTQSEPVSVAGGLNVYPQQIPVPLSRQQSATFTAPQRRRLRSELLLARC